VCVSLCKTLRHPIHTHTHTHTHIAWSSADSIFGCQGKHTDRHRDTAATHTPPPHTHFKSYHITSGCQNFHYLDSRSVIYSLSHPTHTFRDGGELRAKVTSKEHINRHCHIPNECPCRDLRCILEICQLWVSSFSSQKSALSGDMTHVSDISKISAIRRHDSCL
jgi:hypothetical protein